MRNHWTLENIPDQMGRVAIVTGANSGIGFETAKALAAKGATVILACRNRDKAHKAADDIHHDAPAAKLQIIRIDLADLESVREFAEQVQARTNRLDLLINNAGVMYPPYTQTKDGFELQFGANHLGHFALTGLLLDIILATPGSRIVNVSSVTHRLGIGTIDFENLNGQKGYNAPRSYGWSKLANLLFTLQLNKQLQEIDNDTIATSAHPGWTATGLQRGLVKLFTKIVGQSPAMGALPTLRAAVDQAAQPNDYYGPQGLMEMRGYPVKVDTSAAAKDEALAQKLWGVSENMTGVHYNWDQKVSPSHAAQN